MLIVPPSVPSELLPLFCRSLSRFDRNDCNAAVPEEAGVVDAAAVAVPLVVAVALEAAAVVPAVAGVDAAPVPEAAVLADVLPPSALINWVNALLRFEIAPDDKFDPVVLVTI